MILIILYNFKLREGSFEAHVSADPPERAPPGDGPRPQLRAAQLGPLHPGRLPGPASWGPITAQCWGRAGQ